MTRRPRPPVIVITDYSNDRPLAPTEIADNLLATPPATQRRHWWNPGGRSYADGWLDAWIIAAVLNTLGFVAGWVRVG